MNLDCICHKIEIAWKCISYGVGWKKNERQERDRWAASCYREGPLGSACHSCQEKAFQGSHNWRKDISKTWGDPLINKNKCKFKRIVLPRATCQKLNQNASCKDYALVLFIYNNRLSAQLVFSNYQGGMLTPWLYTESRIRYHPLLIIMYCTK